MYTPGPWEVRTEEPFTNEIFGIDRGGMRVLRAKAYGSCAEEISDNAHLIAAAPELLQQLESAVVWLEDGGPAKERENAIAFMKETIAKAEGR